MYLNKSLLTSYLCVRCVCTCLYGVCICVHVCIQCMCLCVREYKYAICIVYLLAVALPTKVFIGKLPATGGVSLHMHNHVSFSEKWYHHAHRLWAMSDST